MVAGNACLFGCLHQLIPGSLQQFGIRGGDGFLLHGGVHHHAGQRLCGNELQAHCELDGQGEQFFQAFFSQQATKLHQGGGVTEQALLVLGLATKVLPARCLVPALDQCLVAEVEGVLQVQQRDHGAQRHAGAPGVGVACHGGGGFVKQIQIEHGLAAGAGRAGHSGVRAVGGLPAMRQQLLHPISLVRGKSRQHILEIRERNVPTKKIVGTMMTSKKLGAGTARSSKPRSLRMRPVNPSRM